MGSTILDGAVIGRGSVVGANSLVTKGTIIPPNSLVLGSPAKVVRTWGRNPGQQPQVGGKICEGGYPLYGTGHQSRFLIPELLPAMPEEKLITVEPYALLYTRQARGYACVIRLPAR